MDQTDREVRQASLDCVEHRVRLAAQEAEVLPDREDLPDLQARTELLGR